MSATRLPDYRKLLLTLPEIAKLDRKDAAELFDYLLANPLVEMLARIAQRLPDWLGLVVTSRPEFDVKTPLQALNPFGGEAQSIFDNVRYCNSFSA